MTPSPPVVPNRLSGEAAPNTLAGFGPAARLEEMSRQRLPPASSGRRARGSRSISRTVLLAGVVISIVVFVLLMVLAPG